jgi:hypothetical protein
MRRIILLLLLAGAAVALNAQDQGAVVLINKAVGSGFNINRSGLEEHVNVGGNTDMGYRLEQGDIVNVEAGTFLELLCLPSNARVYVAELSSFSVTKLGTDGTVGLSLYYGRMRASVAGAGGANGLVIAGPEANALAESSDFGYDYVFGTDGKLLDRIYCVQGGLVVAQRLVDESGGGQGVKADLKTREMVLISGSFAAGQYEKKFFEDDILKYWKENNVEQRLKTLAAVDGNKKSEPVVQKAREENADKTIDELLDRKEEEKQTEEPAGNKEAGQEQAGNQQAGGGGLHFNLDLGFELALLMYGPEADTGGLFDFMRMAGMDWLVDFLNFVFKSRVVTFVDGTLMFNGFIGVGLETGLGYNTLMVGDTTIHFFGIPGYVFVRGNIGLFYAQLFGGVYITGMVVDDNFNNMDVSVGLDCGLRLGVNLGGMTLYTSGILSAPDFDGFFNGSYDFRWGFGLKFNLANF